jgi:hypothetical protein
VPRNRSVYFFSYTKTNKKVKAKETTNELTIQERIDNLRDYTIHTMKHDGKDLDELIGILKWALVKAEALQNSKEYEEEM